MRVLRTILSALCIVLGAALLATWAAATVAVLAIEDSTVIEDSTARALATDAAKDAMIGGGTERALSALSAVGVDVEIPGIRAAVEGIVTAVVNSDTFSEVVRSQAGSIRQQVVTELNGPSVGAITVTLDFTDAVNAGLADLPLVGGSLPTVTVPGIPVQVLDEDAGNSARTLWDWMHAAKQWFGWLGLALLALGVVVSPRKRWYLMKVAWAVAAVSAVVWAIFMFVDPQTIAQWLPGGDIRAAIAVELISSAEEPVTTTMAYIALGATVAALVLFLIAVPRHRKEGP